MSGKQNLNDLLIMLTDQNNFVERMRVPMIKFCLLHIRDMDDAEDIVQEASLGFLVNASQFKAQSQLKTYLFSILKNKITDHIRSKYKRRELIQELRDDPFTIWFDEEDHWIETESIATWANPHDELNSKQFFEILDICIEQLPPKIAEIFSMRELLEFESQEILKLLKIKKDDYWQAMSRARKQLQLCLNTNWFQEST